MATRPVQSAISAMTPQPRIAAASERGAVSAILWLALGAMLAQQTFVSLGKAIVPVIGPAVTGALGVEPALVGAFVAVMGVASILGAVACGPWIQRHGAMRVSQASLFLVALGLAMILAGWLPAIGAGALILGIGTAMATPSSSEILSRYAPREKAALVFSIKQTGVPAGTMLAGLIGPIAVVFIGWQGALLLVAAAALLLALGLLPLTRRFDGKVEAGKPPPRTGMLAIMRATLVDRSLRHLAFAQAAYVGLQYIFLTFFVTFMVVRLDYDLMTAGQVFAGAQLVAVFARVFWGWLCGWIDGTLLLGLLGLAMAAVVALLGFVTPAWSLAAIILVAAALAGTAVAWHGVLLAEIMRHSPPGMVGAMTGGVLAFGSVASVVYPLVMTGLLALTDSYALCFWLSALPPALVAIPLLRGRRR
jgi:MFS family permease